MNKAIWIYVGFVVSFIALALIMEGFDKKRPSFLFSNLEQIFFYLAEIAFICGGLVLISWFIYPAKTGNTGALIFSISERFISVYAVYQIFVLVILNLIDSAYIDQYNALLRLIELVILYRKNRDFNSKSELTDINNDIERKFRVMLHRGSLVSNEVRGEVKKIQENYTLNNKGIDLYLERLKIQTENNIAIKEMFWQGSLLLKILKEWPL